MNNYFDEDEKVNNPKFIYYNLDFPNGIFTNCCVSNPLN